MKKCILFLFLGFLVLISCKSNVIGKTNSFIDTKEVNYIPYYLKVYEADSLHIVGNYSKSDKILDSLFKFFKPLNQESYFEYVTYLKNKIILKEFDNIDLIIKKTIEDYGLTPEICYQDSLIKNGIEKSNYKRQDLNTFYQNYIEKLNLQYRFAIEKMVENDQRVRLAKPVNNDEWNFIDKQNRTDLKELITKFGYPSINKIGNFNFNNNKNAKPQTLFIHSTTADREEYILDLMFMALKNGECEPSNYAIIYDKYLFMTGKYGEKVLYGELRDPKKSLSDLVLNEKNLDSIRKSIGLPHVNYLIWKLKKLTGVDYTKTYSN